MFHPRANEYMTAATEIELERSGKAVKADQSLRDQLKTYSATKNHKIQHGYYSFFSIQLIHLFNYLINSSIIIISVYNYNGFFLFVNIYHSI